MLSSNLSAFQTFLAAAFYQSLAVSWCQDKVAQKHTFPHTHTHALTQEDGGAFALVDASARPFYSSVLRENI